VTAQNDTSVRLDRVTAEDVRTAWFKARYFQPGYDMTQVDELLDQVEETLATDARVLGEIKTVCSQMLQRTGTGEAALALRVLGVLTQMEATRPSEAVPRG
jgi:DivIVA domain-containing protein